MSAQGSLISGVQRLGYVLTPEQVEQFRAYQRQLLDWGRRVNLTAITEPGEVERLHFLDSLAVALALPEQVHAHGLVCDVGSGAGFPGVPLKILFPGMRLTLIDSVSRKTSFLSALVESLGLQGVDVLTGRGEDLAHDSALRESFDAVVARAVAPLRVLSELTLPFCRVGGSAILQKKGDVRQEVLDAARAMIALGGRLVAVMAVPAEVLPGERALVVVEKVAPTPDQYPRRAGIPAKRPL
ncbi:MAG: 16S rRNA (guanine(527)-N(7))-methyltransferase RsmG [Chloroflexi bacterium]|nr:16S rRNA (guanine(527)-N(7))-methyltransferase RsmG [Chloroflexota bacterium]